jgi:hypothetical protein
MVEVRAGSVYREPGRISEPTHDEPLLGEWVSKIVPEAAAFVPKAHRRDQSQSLSVFSANASTVSGSATIAQTSSKQSKKHSVKRTLALWVALVVLFLTLWQYLTPDAETTTAGPPIALTNGDVGSIMAAIVLVAIAALAIRIYTSMRSHRRSEVALRRAGRKLAEGDSRGYVAALDAIVNRRPDSPASSALHAMSLFSERDCELENALAFADAGLARISRYPSIRAMNSDILVPELIAQRAFVLAALHRDAEADAELAVLGRDHSTFAFMTRSLFRVRLLQALRRDDHAEAARLARERTPELPLSRRDEMLADIVLALEGGDVVEGELERIAAELADDPQLAKWIDRMTPGARAKVAARSRTRVAHGEEIAADDAEYGEEPEAELRTLRAPIG